MRAWDGIRHEIFEQAMLGRLPRRKVVEPCAGDEVTVSFYVSDLHQTSFPASVHKAALRLGA